MRLRHRGFRAVDDVRHELGAERQIAILAVDVACFLLIDDKQMVAAGTARDVDVLPQFDVALGAENRQPSIAPCRQAVGGEPVQPDVTGAAVAAEHHVAEVLELGLVLVRHVAGLRRDDVGLRRARVEEELIDLVRADVDEDPAVARLVPEPLGARTAGDIADAVRREVDGLDDAANRARLHEVAGPDGGAHFVALAVQDGVDALGGGLHAPRLGELLERGDAGLVGQVVLAVLHDADADRRPLVRDRGAQHELHIAVEDFLLAARDLRLREPFRVRGGQLRLLRVDGDQLTAAADDRVGHAVDVVVVEADDGEADTRLRRRLVRGRRSLRRLDAA